MADGHTSISHVEPQESTQQLSHLTPYCATLKCPPKDALSVLADRALMQRGRPWPQVVAIAATLLPNGRTLHSRFKVPLNITDESTCHISKRDSTAELLCRCHLIVIDEVTMAHRRVYEACKYSAFLEYMLLYEVQGSDVSVHAMLEFLQQAGITCI